VVSVAPRASLPTIASNNEEYRKRYLEEVAPASIVGDGLKFSKDGDFIRMGTEEKISDAREFRALCDQTLVGWLKFNGPGEAPDREMGLLYGGDYVMPPRESLGDLDQSKWEKGLDGQPQDPWQHTQYVVLQDAESAELFTFITSSRTGRRAVGNLLRHYDRLRMAKPDHYPVVRLKKGGFEHRDPRVGWVSTPVFLVIGSVPSDGSVTPSVKVDDFSDPIGF